MLKRIQRIFFIVNEHFFCNLVRERKIIKVTNKTSFLFSIISVPPIILINEYFFPKKLGLSKEENVNDKCYECGHEYLARVFVPIIHRALSFEDREVKLKLSDLDLKQHEDFELGVIEVGYFIPELSGIDEFDAEEYNKRLFNDDFLYKLKIYVDNYAQMYYKCFLSESKKCCDEILNDLHQSSISPLEYLQNSIDEICQRFSINYGVIFLKKIENPIYLQSEGSNLKYGFSLSADKATKINHKMLAASSKRNSLLMQILVRLTWKEYMEIV